MLGLINKTFFNAKILYVLFCNCYFLEFFVTLKYWMFCFVLLFFSWVSLMHGLYIYIGYNIILLVAYKLFNLKLYKPIEFISTYLHGMKMFHNIIIIW
jgi:hypothetical protein